MKYFKVFFENNVPVSAQMMYEPVQNDIINISKEHDKRILKWLIVYADNEQDAMNAATDLLKRYYAFFGLSES